MPQSNQSEYCRRCKRELWSGYCTFEFCTEQGKKALLVLVIKETTTVPAKKTTTERKHWDTIQKKQMAAIKKMKEATLAYEAAERDFLGL